ncbi:MAG: EAL domain-containing protein, partial [Gammaproteobacteria bacterium]|nr:EAL domain-containing protein [Gammaproteobacteria bacterium]
MARHLRHAVLLIVTLGFVAGVYLAIVNHQRTSELVSSRIQVSAWSLAQLEYEYLRFYHDLELYQHGGTSIDAVRLSFDLLWNRLDVFLNGRENAELRKRFGAEQLVRDVLAELKADEALIFSDAFVPGETARARVQQYATYAIPFRKLIIHNFTGLEASRFLEELQSSRREVTHLLSGMLLFGGALLLMLFLEARRNAFMAAHDELTRLPNRHAFQARLRQHRRKSQVQGVALIELSEFKNVNDHFGHNAGDTVLRRVADALRQHLDNDVFTARIGGDEFLLWFGESWDEMRMRECLHTLSETLVFDFQSEQQIFQVRTRIGLSLNTLEASATPDQLYQGADLSIRELRSAGQQGLLVFDAPLNQRYQRRQRLLGDLKRAIRQPGRYPGLMLYYQPIVDGEGVRRGAEVLLRWKHAELGFISPLEVVELAENHQLGKALGEWILERFSRDLRDWPEVQRDTHFFALNLSASQFDAQLPQRIRDLLAHLPLNASQLVLEITETISMVNFDNSRMVLGQLHRLGVDMALDDFGTGYSSLA